MKNNFLVSIIVPIYNTGKYLKNCIDSLLNQTYKEIEIIAVNDGSTDNSSYIINNYSISHSNIIVISQENKGVSEARRIGLHYARGKYVVFVDSDDWLRSDAIEQMYNICEKDNLDFLETTFSHYRNGRFYAKSAHRNVGLFSGEQFLNIVFDIKEEIAITCAMSKRSIWDDEVFLPTGQRLPNEDLFPCFSIWTKIEKARISNDLPIYYYRHNDASATSTGVYLRRQSLWKEYFIQVRNKLNQLNIAEKYENRLRIFEINRLAFNVLTIDTTDSWYKAIINYPIKDFDTKHKILAVLLRFPKLCKFVILTNRRLKILFEKVIKTS